MGRHSGFFCSYFLRRMEMKFSIAVQSQSSCFNTRKIFLLDWTCTDRRYCRSITDPSCTRPNEASGFG